MKTFFSKVCLVCFGVFLCVFILEMGLRAAGFALTSWQNWSNEKRLREKADIRILCLGESTTFGQYPRYLERFLNANHAGLKFTVIDEGIPGTNTHVIVSFLEQKIERYRPDLVVTMMGVNDRDVRISAGDEKGYRAARGLDRLKILKLFRWVEMQLAAKAREVGWLKGLFSEARPSREYDFKKDLESREKTLSQHLRNEPGDDNAYVDLGLVYKDQERISEAELSFKKAVEIDPTNDSAYAELGWLYAAHNRMAESQEAFKRAVEINPRNAQVWDILAAVYQSRRLYPEAQEAFRKATEANPGLAAGYTNLGLFLLKRGDKDQAEAFFKKAIEKDPGNGRAVAGLAILYCETGNKVLCREYFRQVKDMSDDIYGPMTRFNYRKTREILLGRNLGWICVQYPTLKVSSLKKVVEGDKSIVFVDNEESFKSAVQREGYLRYFMDTMGGTWGHCTDAGNELLARNIADAIKDRLRLQER